jgi:hypothetical protein
MLKEIPVFSSFIDVLKPSYGLTLFGPAPLGDSPGPASVPQLLL